MTHRSQFHPLQAEEIARAFQLHDVDLVFARDGIASFDEAKARGWQEGIFRVANLRDIIASKRASGRQKDLIDLPLLESFRVEFEKRHAPPLRSAADVAADRPEKQ